MHFFLTIPEFGAWHGLALCWGSEAGKPKEFRCCKEGVGVGWGLVSWFSQTSPFDMRRGGGLVSWFLKACHATMFIFLFRRNIYYLVSCILYGGTLRGFRFVVPLTLDNAGWWKTPGDGKLRVMKLPWWWNHIIRTPWNIGIPRSQIFHVHITSTYPT